MKGKRENIASAKGSEEHGNMIPFAIRRGLRRFVVPILPIDLAHCYDAN
jgi:hypothetical protein